MSQGFQYYIIFTNQLLIYPKFISNITNIIGRKVHKFNTLYLKCFPGFMQQLENLVFVEFPRFLLFFFSIGLSQMYLLSKFEDFITIYAPEGTSGGILKSHRLSVRPSVRLSVRPSVRPSVSPSVRYKSCLSDIS